MTLKNVIKILKEDTTLTAMLAEGNKSIYHLKSPDAGTYPIIIVSIISDIPVLRYDDMDEHKKQTLRLHIITTDGRYEDIATEIINVLKQYPQIKRTQTTEFAELNEFIKLIDFEMID